jgi:hypothetical protein
MRTQNENTTARAVNPVVPFTKNQNAPPMGTSAKTEPPATYLTTKELAERIKYTEMSIRNCLQDSVLLEGIHYFHPFGSKKVLYIWEVVEAEMRSRAGCGPVATKGMIKGSLLGAFPAKARKAGA